MRLLFYPCKKSNQIISIIFFLRFPVYPNDNEYRNSNYYFLCNFTHGTYCYYYIVVH